MKKNSHTWDWESTPLPNQPLTYKTPKLVGLDIIIWFGIESAGVGQIDRWMGTCYVTRKMSLSVNTTNFRVSVCPHGWRHQISNI